MPPSICGSEALVIWMFSTAMKAPSRPENTEIQVVRLARSAGGAPAVVVAEDIAVALRAEDPPRSMRGRFLLGGIRLGVALLRVALLRVDGRDHRHAGAQLAGQRVVAVEHDLDRDALDNLGEV